MKYSIRRKTVAYIILLIILAFALGLTLCAVFATRYYTEVIQEKMRNAYDAISGMYQNDSYTTRSGRIPQIYYRELAEI